MEGDLQPQTPVAEAQPEAAPAAASQPAERYLTAQERLARVFEPLPENDPREVSNGTTPAATPTTEVEEPDEEPSEPTESKPSEAPKPGDGEQPPKPLSRRQQAEAADKARIAELEAAVESERQAREAAIEQARSDERERVSREQQAEAARIAATAYDEDYLGNEDRFQASLRMRDTDPRLSEPAPDGKGTLWDWRELRKERREQHPHVERHYQTVAEQRIAAERTAITTDAEQREQGFWNGVRAQVIAAASLPHVKVDDLKPDAPKPLTTWDQMAGYYHAAGAAWKEAEYTPQLTKATERIAELEATVQERDEQIKDLRLVGPRGLGSERAPVHGGASAGADASPPRFDERRSPRDNLAAALGF